MQTVNILRHNSEQLAGLLKFRKLFVGSVRLRVKNQHLIFIKAVEFVRPVHKKCMADDLLGRILIFQVIQPVL